MRTHPRLSLACTAILAAAVLPALGPAATAATPASGAPTTGSATAVPATAVPATAVPAGAACDPTQTPAGYRGAVPSPREVLGFDLGDQEVTVAESDGFLAAVAAASDRVVAGTMATSAQGRPLRYAIVGRPDRVTGPALAKIRRDAALLRDPATSPAHARRIADRAPLILWIAGNVHGGEESGTDAALRTLWDLSDRTDCAARRILDNAIVVIVPTQNPDGREADTRQNAYGFDMNRDWFARTQPETDGKLELLRAYPPQLFIDAHEMGGTSYFFPPNDDPIYHDIPEPAIGWINDVHGPALSAEFDRRGIDYFNYETYDLFYMGYGDSVPTTGFGAAGMTFEKGGVSPIAERTLEQYLTQWTSLSAAADRREQMLRTWHGMFVTAYEQGRAGLLEENLVYKPGDVVTNPVPDRRVRHYFLRADDPDKRAEVTTIVRRLQRMDVAVHRLTRPLAVADYKAYGRPAGPATLPAGTYWIPMAQGQKHWIQAMLHEDSYMPLSYAYDVTEWSMPLIGNVDGGSSGAVLAPKAARLPVLPAPDTAVRGERPSLAVLQLSATSTTARESTGWLRHRLDRDWRLDYRLLTPADVAAGALSGVEVLLVPNGPAASARAALGAAGQAALRDWVSAGGRYVGWSGGGELAQTLGLTTARFEPVPATVDAPGNLFRVSVDPASPLGAGVGRTAWQMYSFDAIVHAADPATVAVSYPAQGSPDWGVAGYQSGAADAVAGTALVVDEPVGSGRTVVFAADPNFRAFTDGTAKLLRNAILGPDPAGARARLRAGAAPEPAPLARALTLESPVRVTVAPADAAATARVLRDLGATWVEQRAAGRVRFLVDNPGALPADEHPWARRLPTILRGAGVTPIAVSLV